MNKETQDIASLKLPVVVGGKAEQWSAASALQQQYERTGNAVGNATREMVIFGAMLEKVDDALTPSRHNPDGTGVSLKSWLDANCPAINYNTAMNYRKAAKGVRNMLNMAADVPLLPLMGMEPVSDEEQQKLRDKIIDVIGKSSLNVLRQAASPLPPQNALKGTHGIAKGKRALTAEEKAAYAETEMRELLGKVGAYLRGPWFNMLTQTSQDDFVRTLKDYALHAEERGGLLNG